VAGAVPFRSATDPVFVRVGIGTDDVPGVRVGRARIEEGEQSLNVSVRVSDGTKSGTDAGAASKGATGPRSGKRSKRRSGLAGGRWLDGGPLRLLGVTAVGPDAENLVALPTLALQAGVSLERLRELTVTDGATVRVLQQALVALRTPSGGSGHPASRL
jgi:hypothetical protein